jgi:hypothetical protein
MKGLREQRARGCLYGEQLSQAFVRISYSGARDGRGGRGSARRCTPCSDARA